MSHYRRAYIPGGCYFFTAVTHHREAWFSTQENVDRLREAFRHVKNRHPFAIDAIVVLPDHIHTVWRLPDGDADFSLRWRLLKHYVAIKLSNGTNNRGEKQFWQRRFWEHVIRGETDWRNHIDYIHYNPVKHDYVTTPAQWPYSSNSQFKTLVK
ncbi:transposase [Methylomarinum sp. Ch1-1]|uniref:Transposase n=1 Tax=Methylomarinum roseum TaxID=3067653 RepID=A0AAU7NUV8_9GAMM|nr:transposase [Methylomarinum sp. Ch1-1]MDP4519489.1 transposase [Methylomarinum sp. Ch1-1]